MKGTVVVVVVVIVAVIGQTRDCKDRGETWGTKRMVGRRMFGFASKYHVDLCKVKAKEETGRYINQ